jgi:hypothetical protein
VRERQSKEWCNGDLSIRYKEMIRYMKMEKHSQEEIVERLKGIEESNLAADVKIAKVTHILTKLYQNREQKH